MSEGNLLTALQLNAIEDRNFQASTSGKATVADLDRQLLLGHVLYQHHAIVSRNKANQRLVELMEKCEKHVDREEASIFRLNNPFGKEIREILKELRAEIKKVKGQ